MQSTINSISRLEGTVYWVTGLPGAGKTTLAKRLYEYLLLEKTNTVFLDGDILREVFGQIFDYSKDERLQLAKIYSRLCKMLSSQGQNVVIATVSMFAEVRALNRNSLSSYKEIFVDPPKETLIQRNQKSLFSIPNNQIGNTASFFSLDFELPKHPDYITSNTLSPDQEFTNLVQALFSKKGSV